SPVPSSLIPQALSHPASTFRKGPGGDGNGPPCIFPQHSASRFVLRAQTAPAPTEMSSKSFPEGMLFMISPRESFPQQVIEPSVRTAQPIVSPMSVRPIDTALKVPPGGWNPRAGLAPQQWIVSLSTRIPQLILK